MKFEKAPSRRVASVVMNILAWLMLPIGATGAAFCRDGEKLSQGEEGTNGVDWRNSLEVDLVND